MVSVSTNRKSTNNKSSEKKEKIRARRRKREYIIIPEYSTLKTKLLSIIVKIGKEKEYFTYEDIFVEAIIELNVDAKDTKKLKALYSYINSIMIELEDNGFAKGFLMPGQRRVFWKLIRSPVSPS